ncbi:nephrin [Aplysia californica]|uniref:Nephrin n=1 Tax=Aplysia californica TaxID=6500 RepID=A0ABM1A843_APLCA|nr:nephrin [Aplysia californica]
MRTLLHALSLLPALFIAVDSIQHFTEIPKNTNVIRGQTAVLKCVIGDRKGAVQWTKDGFPLGFNRTIPGFSRYSISSTNDDEFNLMIVNADLVDDATFECQVLPKDGDDPLRASATLTVLVPCEPPKILDYNNGSTVEVPHTQETLELTCEARLGRPAASIDWYRNGIKVTENIRYGVESLPGDKRETARSTLTVSLSNHHEENGAVYRCEASNSAVFGPALTASVSLSILFPPGPPEISGYGGRVVKINDSLVLTCVSKGGNPLGTVTWYRNDQPVDWSFTSGSNRAINEYTFKVGPSDNNAVYRCQVTNLVATEPLTSEYRLTVHFPPTSVTMSGAQSAVKAGRRVTLTCVSSNSNPRATIMWVSKENQLPRSDVTETYSESPDGGYITTSRVRVTVRHQDHNSKVTCRASNSEFGQTVADMVTLTVLYPPNAPHINGYVQGSSIRAGDLERMTCISIGGNPIADVKWYKGNKLIRDAVYKKLTNIASSELAIVVDADDNGARYTCKASNRATPTPLQVSITLTVHFPPAHVVISLSPSQPSAGQQVDLTCVSSSSNPAAEITWLRNGRRMTGVSLGTVEAEHGGKNTTNRLRFYPTSRDHNAVFGCRATNRLLDQSVTDAITLNVLFKPEFNDATLPSKIDVKKGERTSINLTAYANPPNVTYTLFKGGSSFSTPSRFRLGNGYLNISSISKNDKGNYTIKGENNQGFSTFNFSINVKYPARVVDITNRLSLNEGDTAMFACKVDANPMVPNIVTWTRSDFDMSRTQTKVEGETTYLSVPDLTKEDAGTFKCVADNRIGSPATSNARLIVKFKPVIDKSPETSRSAGEKGTTVTLKCNAEGAPSVSISWTRNNRAVRSGSKYRINSRSSGSIRFESTLKVKNLTREDYGAYVCTAANSKGSDSHSITLSGTSKPYPPSNITFVNATSNSITLRWKAGFDGGLPQSFRVRYKPTDKRGYVYVDVRPYGANIYKIKGLDLGTLYEFAVLAFNDRGESSYIAQGIQAKTSDVVAPTDIATKELEGADEIPVIIILVVCIVGVFILALNVGLILFFIQRRKKRLEAGASETTSHTNTFELYGTGKGDHSMCPAPSDDTRSYGTYDKSMDDFSDDYIRDYEGKTGFAAVISELETLSYLHENQNRRVEGWPRRPEPQPCETHVFLPPQSDSPPPGSRPYSPHKMEPQSPRLGGHKMTYIVDDHQGRRSPWNEDPYKMAHPRSKKGFYENGVQNGDIYEFKSGSRGKGMNELSDRPPSRPSSRSGKTPPPPPTRSSSRGGDYIPPLPARNYDPEEIAPPRYGPTPGSSSLLSPNIVPNPSYRGPTSPTARSPSPHHQQYSPSPHDTLPVGAEMRGHLV